MLVRLVLWEPSLPWLQNVNEQSNPSVIYLPSEYEIATCQVSSKMFFIPLRMKKKKSSKNSQEVSHIIWFTGDLPLKGTGDPWSYQVPPSTRHLQKYILLISSPEQIAPSSVCCPWIKLPATLNFPPGEGGGGAGSWGAKETVQIRFGGKRGREPSWDFSSRATGCIDLCLSPSLCAVPLQFGFFYAGE